MVCVSVCVCMHEWEGGGEREGERRGQEKERGLISFYHLLQTGWSSNSSAEHSLLWTAKDERKGHVWISKEDGKKNLKQRFQPCKACRPYLFCINYCTCMSLLNCFQGKWFLEHVKQNDNLMCRLEPIRASVSMCIWHRTWTCACVCIHMRVYVLACNTIYMTLYIVHVA